MEKRNFLFRFVPAPLRNQLQLDDEALYSTTDQLTADKICKDLLKVVPSSAVVTDATACIGGSSLSLSKVFAKVHAIELDETRYKFLKHNMEALCLTNVTCHHGDALDICPLLEQDLVFLDPPWGGPEYKTHTKVSLKLSELDLADVCIRLASCAQYIAIKVPVNFDEDKFLQATHRHLTLEQRNTQLRKMHLIILKSGSWKTVGTTG